MELDSDCLVVLLEGLNYTLGLSVLKKLERRGQSQMSG